MFMGEFNINLTESNIRHDFLNLIWFEPQIYDYTRISATSSTCIDNVLTNFTLPTHNGSPSCSLSLRSSG